MARDSFFLKIPIFGQIRLKSDIARFAAARAIEDGVNLKGYFIWSLVDNFEWSSGFSRRFGLVHVNHLTQERTLKDSGYWVKEMIQSQPKI